MNFTFIIKHTRTKNLTNPFSSVKLGRSILSYMDKPTRQLGRTRSKTPLTFRIAGLSSDQEDKIQSLKIVYDCKQNSR